jgi:hypothetical protein
VGARGLGAVTFAVVAILAWPAPARAFDLGGHYTIEATAYKRILALSVVPELGVSGREVIADLIAGGVLFEPPCFNGWHPRGGCSAEDRLRRPLAYWPVLRSGAADLIIDRQLSARAQCQHFMADTANGLSPRDPRTGVPEELETTAYERCVEVIGLAFDGILRNPTLAGARLVGMYALIHAVEDSFSRAHVARDATDPSWRIQYLTSWNLLDWPAYLRRGIHSYPPTTHHAVTDERDEEYVRADGFADDGRACSAIKNPYAVPESCLTPRARAAADAVVDLLLLTYQLRARARAAGRTASLASEEDLELWRRYVRTHFSSTVVASPPDPPPGVTIGFPRTDLFLGVRGSIGRDATWGANLWGSQLFYGPAVPFALLLSGGAGIERAAAGDNFVAAMGLGLALPLVRRFAIGFTPIGVALACDTGFDHCTTTPYATLGVLVVPLPHSLWLGLEGPRWSWNDRSLKGAVFALSLGWSHELRRKPPQIDERIVAAWDPPVPGEVLAYRSAPVSWVISFAATAASTDRDRWVGGQFDLRWDRDRWNQRKGPGAGLFLAAARGTIAGAYGNGLALGPTLFDYLAANRLALVATPASLRLNAQDGRTLGWDVAGLLSLIVDLTKIEVAVDSPPLSYVSRSRWHDLPVVVRLGLLLE